MFDKVKTWVASNPWRLVAIVLGLGVIGSVTALALSGEPESEETAVGVSTTIGELEPGETLPPAEEGPPLSSPSGRRGTPMGTMSR